MTARILAPCYLEHILDFGQTGHDPVEVLCIVDADGQADDGTVVLHLTGVHGVDGDADVSQRGQHIGQQLVAVEGDDLQTPRWRSSVCGWRRRSPG